MVEMMAENESGDLQRGFSVENMHKICACFQFKKAARIVGNLYDQELAAIGLTSSQMALLVGVRSYPNINMKVLAQRLSLDPTTFSRSIKLLKKRGYLVSSKCGDDQRAQRLSLSVEGERVLSEALPCWRQAQSKVEKALGKEELIDILEKIEMLGIVRGQET